VRSAISSSARASIRKAAGSNSPSRRKGSRAIEAQSEAHPALPHSKGWAHALSGAAEQGESGALLALWFSPPHPIPPGPLCRAPIATCAIARQLEEAAILACRGGWPNGWLFPPERHVGIDTALLLLPRLLFNLAGRSSSPSQAIRSTFSNAQHSHRC
jgi:hypothetical protein